MTDKKIEEKGSDTYRTQIHPAPNRCWINHKARSLSRSARQRLKWMEHFRKYRNARLTCRHFGISPDTFYLWRKRFVPADLQTLEDNLKTRRPYKVRVSRHKVMQLETIKKLKDIDPRLGKIRIAKILQETGYKISSSTVSRMLKEHKELTLESKET